MSNTFLIFFQMKILLTCACISLDMNSVIPAIRSDLQRATTTCSTTFFPEPERLWQTMQRGKHKPIP